MTQPKKLIEVAMPIKEISAESVRDKSIRHGHISTLHLWWARRPLPVCRAVVFASLVPDPLDENCPKAFKDAVQLLLGQAFSLKSGESPVDWYKPYDDIPYTAAVDQMEDNLRNRLLMFIGKFSDKYAKMGEKTPAKDMLTEASLIKWDNKNNEEIIGKARKLIWVSHNASSGKSSTELLTDFEHCYQAIKDAELELYSTPDRHIASDDITTKEIALHNAIEAFLDKMPKVFDPFAGGGAIPLEAARLGCKTFGNDINPVAHIIQKGSLEFPQKYGKPITYSKAEFVKMYGQEELIEWCASNSQHPDAENLQIEIPNHLSFDVEFYAKKILAETEKEIGHYYPKDNNDKHIVAFYWVRVANCSNPTCNAAVPLLKGFNFVDTKNKNLHLKPIIEGNKITFEIRKGRIAAEGWLKKANLSCPCCGSVTQASKLKEQFKLGKTSEKILFKIMEGVNSKEYLRPTENDISILRELPKEINKPTEKLEIGNKRNFNTPGWGIDSFGGMFSDRQALILNFLVKGLKDVELPYTKDYQGAIKTNLAIWFNRIASRMTSFGIWNTKRETIEHPFGRQAIPMVFDYPESNPFSAVGGGALNQLQWVLRYIESEGNNSFYSLCNNASSGEKNQFNSKYLNAVVTDPPYYDAIAYGDISDFFYVWLKLTLGNLYPLNFATPKTPKTEECTALQHHHGSVEGAKKHFETKLLQIFDAIEYQTSDIVSIMFAHQSTEAWTTLCNSILGANMNITGSWATDTELTGALKKDMASLSSSVTVSAKPSQRTGVGDFKDVKKAIEQTVAKEVEELYRLGFRGADLLTACFGKAVSEFGKYEKVEKADGSNVSVAELLEMAKESAFNALLKGFDGDEFTKFYIGWLQIYGFVESDFDDAAKFTKVGLSINVSELFKENILIKKGNRQTLGGFQERLLADKHLGERSVNYLIDNVHKAMNLYKGTNRQALLSYLGNVAANSESSFWRVVTSLCEVLPAGSEDYKQANGLLANKDSLIRESRQLNEAKPEQIKLEL